MRVFIFEKGNKHMRWTYYEYCNLMESDKGDKLKVCSEETLSSIIATTESKGWKLLNNQN